MDHKILCTLGYMIVVSLKPSLHPTPLKGSLFYRTLLWHTREDQYFNIQLKLPQYWKWVVIVVCLVRSKLLIVPWTSGVYVCTTSCSCMYSPPLRPREYIQLPSVVQIQYTLDIHGTTTTCMLYISATKIYRPPASQTNLLDTYVHVYNKNLAIAQSVHISHKLQLSYTSYNLTRNVNKVILSCCALTACMRHTIFVPICGLLTPGTHIKMRNY